MKRHSTITGIIMAIAFLALTTATAQEKINLAGIYELNVKADLSSNQMYLELDFVNQRPDFTQTFTGKTAKFKLLPEDFMNAKKLKKNFKGTKAPGFGRYREKTLFSLTEEFKITNPHSKQGVIIADWEDAMSKTGKVIILPNEDGSIVTYGLTGLDRSLSPDGMRLELVKNLLPENVAGGKWTDGAKSGTQTAGFIEEIRTACGQDLPGTIKRLVEMPDGGNVKKPAATGSNKEIPINLCGDNEPVMFMFHTVGNGGDYGKFETNSQLDFWQEDNGEISMRQYTTVVYLNSGRKNESEYIYTGRKKGNTIVFTRKTDSFNGGEPQKVTSTLTIKSTTSLVFDRWTYTRMKFDNRSNNWVPLK